MAVSQSQAESDPHGYDQVRLTRTCEAPVFIVEFLAAALASADDTLFTESLVWSSDLLARRGVPTRVLIASLEALRLGVAHVDVGAMRLLEAGRGMLVMSTAAATASA